MKQSFKDILIRCLILMVGLTIAHFGVTLYLLSNLGSDPFNVLVQGTHKVLSGVLSWGIITHGNIHIALCLLIVLILLFVDRSYIKIGTILCMLFGGPIIDGFTYLLGSLFTIPHSVIIDVLTCVVACVILAFGMTIVIKSEAGTGPNDLVSLVISDKSKKEFGVVRIMTDGAFVLIGFLLGGAAGIGTLICVFVVGPVAGRFMPICEKAINGIMNKIAK